MNSKGKFVVYSSLIFVFILIVSGLIYVSTTYKKALNKQKKYDELQQKVSEIESHYNKYVITNKETKLFKLDNSNYIEAGKINKDVLLTLDDTLKIEDKTEYFYVPSLNLYIYFNDVEKTEQTVDDVRYKNYIPFNNNIITKDKTSFYDIEGTYLYTIYNSFDFPVLINDETRYGVEFANKLLFVNKEEVDSIYDKNNGQTNKSRIRTLTYHYIYNQALNSCTQAICQSFEQFESQLQYIKNNNYFTLTLPELELYLDGKLNIPEKSIVITIDDGSVFDDGAAELLEKYDVRATMFLITGRYNDISKFISPNIDLESHTDNMHNAGECAGYGSQGGGILCLPEEKVLQDLKTCQDKVGGSKYFAYPFFDFSDRAISLLKKAGYTMAFIGQYNTDGYSYPGKTDKYKVPRKTMFLDTTMNEFISYLK